MSDAVRTTVIFDLDNTVTRVDTYPKFLLSILARRPSRWMRAAILPLDLAIYRLGFQDNQWLKERALGGIAGGASPVLVERQSRELVEDIVDSKLRSGANSAIEQHRAAGHYLVLATASFDIYTRMLAEKLGFHDVVCTIAEQDKQGRLTGRIVGKNCYGEEKLRRIAECMEGGRNQWNVIVYTDHHSDLPLLEWADSPRVVNPSAKMRRIANERGYPILDW
jgi:phosphatidylglycerophosphatase C